MIKLLRTLLVAPLALTLALPAYAQNIDIGGSAGADVEVADRVDVNADADADASVQDDSSDDAADDADVGVRGQGSGTASFSLSRDDAEIRNSSGGMVSAESVNTSSDLEAYAAAALRTSDTFKGVDVDGDRMVLRYSEEARLFGFIPHTLTSRIEVAGDGSVRIVRPWYSFLAAGLSADASADLEARVRQALKDSDGSLSARTQARVLAELTAALGGTAVQASASADAGMTASESEDEGTEAMPN